MLKHLWVLLLLPALISTGCGESGKTSDGRKTIAVIPKGTVHEFWKSVEAGAKRAGDEMGVEILWDGPEKETMLERQRQIIDNMVSSGVDGIVLAPQDEQALERPVRMASKAGVPVVIFDSDVRGEAHIAFVATDNLQGGKLAGEHMVKLLGDNASGAGIVMIRYMEGSGSTDRRESGFLEVADAAGVKLLDSQYTDGSADGAMKVAVNVLSNYIVEGKLNVAGVFASNQSTALGTQGALDRLAKQGIDLSGTRFIGFDASDKLIDGVRSGRIDALVVQDPEKMGYLSVKTMVAHLDGKPVEKYVDTGVGLVTKDNLDSPDIRALLGME